MAYRLKNFLSNVDKVIQEEERKKKNKEIAKVIAALQQPMKDVLGAVVEKQIQDFKSLSDYLNLNWNNKKR